MNPEVTLAIQSLKDAKFVAVDTETTGLNTRKDKCLGLGISTSETTGFFFHAESDIRLVLPYLRNKRLLAWNAYFDLEIVRNNYGVDLWEYLYADVMLLKHTIDENPPFGLKDVAAATIGSHVKQDQDDLKFSIKMNGGAPNDFSKADINILAKYCVQDCKLTMQLFNIFSKKLTANLVKLFYVDEVMPLYKTVTRFLQSEGVKVDLDLLTTMKTDIRKDITLYNSKILSEMGDILTQFKSWFYNKNYPIKRSGSFAQKVIQISGRPIKTTPKGKFSTTQKVLETFRSDKWIGFILGYNELTKEEVYTVQHLMHHDISNQEILNLNSKQHLKVIFFDILKEHAISYTDLGSPQVDDDFLEIMSKKYEWCNSLQIFNKLNKLSSSYINRLLEEQEDGVFYPQFAQHRTTSGRFGSDFQQLPRKSGSEDTSVVDRYRNRIRDVIIAGDGYKLVGADWNSLEPRVFAHVSGDQKLKDVFLNGEDFYSKIAIGAEKISNMSAKKSDENYLGKINPELRQKAKAYSLGIPYGMESYALSKSLDTSQDEAQSIILNYLAAFPDLANWMEHTKKTFKTYGQAYSQAGRVRHLQHAKRYYDQYGDFLFDQLQLWKDYNEDAQIYKDMKKKRSIVKNAINNALNFQIQSLSASIGNRCMIELNKQLSKYNSKVVMNVHDEIVVRCKSEHADEVAKILQNVMENHYKISIPLEAPVHIADRYGGTK